MDNEKILKALEDIGVIIGAFTNSTVVATGAILAIKGIFALVLGQPLDAPEYAARMRAGYNRNKTAISDRLDVLDDQQGFIHQRLATVLAVVFALVLLATAAFAQTGACPTANTLTIFQVGATINGCMNPSLDPNTGHGAADSENRPVITRYDLLLFNASDPVTATPQSTISIGKPVLNPENSAWFVIPNASVPINRQLRASVVAVGQIDIATGQLAMSARSSLSNPFGVSSTRVPAVVLGSPVVP